MSHSANAASATSASAVVTAAASAAEWEESRNWFNTMEPNLRNQLILNMYRLTLSTKDISHRKLTDSLNSQWQERLDVQKNEQKRLQIQNEVLLQNQQQHVGILNETIHQLESRLSDSLNAISLRITPSSNGKLGENYIESLLGKVPGSNLINTSQLKGGGDFLYVQGDVRVMIESKNWTNSSIKSNPKELETFRQDAIAAKEENKIDYAIMALHRVTDLKGRAISLEYIHTRTGRLLLIFVTNLFNHPDRILYAIDAGMLLLQQHSQEPTAESFLYRIDTFLKGINSFEESIKERAKIIKGLTENSKKDSEQLMVLRQTLNCIIYGEDQIPVADRVLTICWQLMNDHNDVTKTVLEEELVKNNFPARWVRDLGGIKEVKRLATEKFKANLKIEEPEELKNDNGTIE